MVTEEFFNLN